MYKQAGQEDLLSGVESGASQNEYDIQGTAR